MRATVGSSGVGVATGTLDFGSGARSPTDCSPSRVCVPSQYGPLAVALHWHKAAGPDLSAVNLTGDTSVPACDPSQNGWLFDLPQAHQK